MKRYEYTVLDVPAKGFWFGGKINHEQLTAKLNELGGQGWEAVSSGNTTMNNGASRSLVIILKREIN